MKKKLNLKLQLRKSTIAKLTDDNLNNLKGGGKTEPNCISETIVGEGCGTIGCLPYTHRCPTLQQTECIPCRV